MVVLEMTGICGEWNGMEATNASSSSWITLMIGEWKAMLTRKRVNR